MWSPSNGHDTVTFGRLECHGFRTILLMHHHLTFLVQDAMHIFPEDRFTTSRTDIVTLTILGGEGIGFLLL